MIIRCSKCHSENSFYINSILQKLSYIRCKACRHRTSNIKTFQSANRYTTKQLIEFLRRQEEKKRATLLLQYFRNTSGYISIKDTSRILLGYF